MSRGLVVRTSRIVFCISMALFSFTGQAAFAEPTHESQQWNDERAAIAGICLAAPQRQIHTKAELRVISHRMKAQAVSPSDFRDFLLLIVRMRLELVQSELDMLSNLHKILLMGSGSGVSKEEQHSIDMNFSQCEMPLITKQLLERELYALEAWKPGMSSEKALAIADQQRKAVPRQ